MANILRTLPELPIARFERYQKLEPFVTALPIGTSINLCTASPEVLDSLIPGITARAAGTAKGATP